MKFPTLLGFEDAKCVVNKRRSRVTKTRVSVYKIENILPYVAICEHGRNVCYETQKSAIDAASCPFWCPDCWGDREPI
jgi:hypothetical protein